MGRRGQAADRIIELKKRGFDRIFTGIFNYNDSMEHFSMEIIQFAREKEEQLKEKRFAG